MHKLECSVITKTFYIHCGLKSSCKLVDICLNWMLITENLHTTSINIFYVSHCIYDIFQLEKIIASQTGRKNKQHKNFNILSTGNEESRN